MNKSYHWEVQPSEEVKPYFILTNTDSVADAAQQFEDSFGDISIMFIRKISVSTNFKYDDDFMEAI